MLKLVTTRPAQDREADVDRALSGAALAVVALVVLIVLPSLTGSWLASHSDPWGLLDVVAAAAYVMVFANLVLIPAALLAVTILLIGVAIRPRKPRVALGAARTAATFALAPLVFCCGLTVFGVLLALAPR